MSVNLGSFHYFSTKSPSHSMHFCQSCRILKMPLRYKSVPAPRNQLRTASWTASSSRVVVTSQVIFRGTEQMLVSGGQIRTVGWMGEQFPAVLCSSVPVNKRGTQRAQTFRYPKISIIPWTAWCPTPSCAAISLNVILRSCLMSS
jgi:hypothetical protein